MHCYLLCAIGGNISNNFQIECSLLQQLPQFELLI